MLRKIHYSSISKQLQQILIPSFPLENIRNIGIIAHIDAGKTTTTERFLLNSGMINRAGNVDAGTTMMDFLRQERERGITIASATISFPWQCYDDSTGGLFRINLIDTPGHVDFTIEVERSLRVLDGAIAIIDGCSGIEAQTETVWLQSSHYGIPKLLFVNKLDREGFLMPSQIISQCRSRLGIEHAVPLQVGFFESSSPISSFPWIIDLVTLKRHSWNYGLHLIEDVAKWSQECSLDTILEARRKLVEVLAEIDQREGNKIMELYLQYWDRLENIPTDVIIDSIRWCVKTHKMVPVFYGASLRNWGIEPLLDGIIRYLPSPAIDVSLPTLSSFHKRKEITGAAFVFKVIVPSQPTATDGEKQRGVMTFIRVYHGAFHPKETLINCTKQIKERVTKILHMTSDEGREIQMVTVGNFAVLLGLKNTSTGDTLVVADDPDSLLKTNFALPGITIPKPVFFRSLDADTEKDEDALEALMKKLELEDPSLKFEKNIESGQMIISGMGELHLDVVADRIKNDFKIPAKLGPVSIAYKEGLTPSCQLPFTIKKIVDKIVLGKRLHAAGAFRILMKNSITGEGFIPIEESANQVTFKPNFINVDLLTSILRITELKAFQELAQDHLKIVLSNGPHSSFPLIGMEIVIENIEIFHDTTIPGIRALLSEAIREVFAIPGYISIYEPIMAVTIRTPKLYMGSIIVDINSNCKGSVLQFKDEELNAAYSIIDSEIPLASLSSYSTRLRSLSSGTASFNSRLIGYSRLTREIEKASMFLINN